MTLQQREIDRHAWSTDALRVYLVRAASVDGRSERGTLVGFTIVASSPAQARKIAAKDRSASGVAETRALDARDPAGEIRAAYYRESTTARAA